MEDLYPSEFWSTLLVDGIPGTISTSKSQQFCHSIRIALGQNTGKHNCHRQRGIWGIKEYKHRSFWLFLPTIFPKSWTWYKQQLLCSYAAPSLHSQIIQYIVYPTPAFILYMPSHSTALCLIFTPSSSVQLWLLQQQRKSSLYRLNSNTSNCGEQREVEEKFILFILAVWWSYKSF